MEFKISAEDVKKLGYIVCKTCRGTGTESQTHHSIGDNFRVYSWTCYDCNGKGYRK